MKEQDTKKILVIGSDPIYQAEICRLLRLDNYQAIRAGNSADELNLALQKHPNLILCDVNTSDSGDDDTVLEKLHFNDSAPEIPVVLLVNDAEVGNCVRKTQLRPAAYLSKPVPPYKLLQVVATKLQ